MLTNGFDFETEILAVEVRPIKREPGRNASHEVGSCNNQAIEIA